MAECKSFGELSAILMSVNRSRFNRPGSPWTGLFVSPTRKRGFFDWQSRRAGTPRLRVGLLFYTAF